MKVEVSMIWKGHKRFHHVPLRQALLAQPALSLSERKKSLLLARQEILA